MLDLHETLTAAHLNHQDLRVPGYKNRTFTPVGMIWHHTASPAGNALPTRMFTAGRQGLPGPVVQFGIDRQAEIYIFSDGYCNHAGRASRQAVTEIGEGQASDLTARQRHLTDSYWFSANKRLYGIEIDLNGIGEPISDSQLEAAIGVTAAVFFAHGWHSGHLSDHQRVTARKIDVYAPNLPPWPTIREMVDVAIQRLKRPRTTVAPQWDPAAVLEPIVAHLQAPNGGVWLLGNAGGIYAWGNAPFYGRPYDMDGTPARLEPIDGGGYTVITTHGQRHPFPA